MVGRTANGTRQKMGNAFLKNLIGFKADGVFVILGFQEFIKVRQGKGGIPSEVAAQAPLAFQAEKCRSTRHLRTSTFWQIWRQTRDRFCIRVIFGGPRSIAV